MASGLKDEQAGRVYAWLTEPYAATQHMTERRTVAGPLGWLGVCLNASELCGWGEYNAGILTQGAKHASLTSTGHQLHLPSVIDEDKDIVETTKLSIPYFGKYEWWLLLCQLEL